MTDPTDTFEQHRDRLFAIAYRMLGSVARAEDTLQDAWVRWQAVDHERVEHPRAYLDQVVAREALQQLRRERTRRETYVGPWLPEPLLTEADPSETAARAESVSMALLVVLESLTPLERVVFVLHEAFGYGHAEIARMLGRSAPAVRQVAHRARASVTARRPRFAADREEHLELTRRFLRAGEEGDLEALVALLAPDVTLVADRGGHGPAPRRPVEGATTVATFVVFVLAHQPADVALRIVDVNGVPGIVSATPEGPTGAAVLEVADGRIQVVRLLANPEKLSGLGPSAPPRR